MIRILLIYRAPLKKARNFYKLFCDISSMTPTLQKYCKNTIRFNRLHLSQAKTSPYEKQNTTVQYSTDSLRNTEKQTHLSPDYFRVTHLGFLCGIIGDERYVLY